jgi:hypothetical protein
MLTLVLLLTNGMVQADYSHAKCSLSHNTSTLAAKSPYKKQYQINENTKSPRQCDEG